MYKIVWLFLASYSLQYVICFSSIVLLIHSVYWTNSLFTITQAAQVSSLVYKLICIGKTQISINTTPFPVCNINCFSSIRIKNHREVRINVCNQLHEKSEFKATEIVEIHNEHCVVYMIIIIDKIRLKSKDIVYGSECVCTRWPCHVTTAACVYRVSRFAMHL